MYLCAGPGDLSTEQGARTAVYRYNHAGSYVDLVLSIADSCARGDYSAVPNGIPAPTTLTSNQYDLTYPPRRTPSAATAVVRVPPPPPARQPPDQRPDQRPHQRSDGRPDQRHPWRRRRRHPDRPAHRPAAHQRPGWAGR